MLKKRWIALRSIMTSREYFSPIDIPPKRSCQKMVIIGELDSLFVAVTKLFVHSYGFATRHFVMESLQLKNPFFKCAPLDLLFSLFCGINSTRYSTLTSQQLSVLSATLMKTTTRRIEANALKPKRWWIESFLENEDNGDPRRRARVSIPWSCPSENLTDLAVFS